jgi:hypothetical protein
MDREYLPMLRLLFYLLREVQTLIAFFLLDERQIEDAPGNDEVTIHRKFGNETYVIRFALF